MRDGADVAPPSVDELLVQLRERVEQRRRDGDYPPDLEAQLGGHFARIVSHRQPPTELREVRDAAGRLRAAGSFSPGRIAYSARVKGLDALHKVVGKLVSRQTAGVLAQVQAHADALNEFVDEVLWALEHPKHHEHGELSSELDLLFERLTTFSRAATGGPALGSLTKRVEALEEERSRRRFQPWFSNARFEDAFRGAADEIRDRYKDLAARFVGADGRVVDLGCGRGEFVELLLELGVDASGIEIDPALVALNQDRDLPVEYGSIVTWLEAQPDQDLGGLASIQVVEHISAQELVEFVSLAHRKVKPGGHVVVETVNPQSLYVFAHAFYLDPTHLAPVHPAYLMFLFKEAGFSKVDIEWRSPCPADDVLQATDGDTPVEKQMAANVDRLNQLLFAPQDYALVATR